MDEIIIIKGDVEIIRAIIAGINIMLVTSSAPTILIVARTENDKMVKNINSSISTFIPLDEATSLLRIIRMICR